ncbi:hypothetical protein FXO37_30092 [Capsicum annuum]|nr:hypothetical protein FXO37_30092 [Capsicum annuum]
MVMVVVVFVVVVVAPMMALVGGVDIRGVCLFVGIVQRDSEEIPEQSQSGKSNAEERCENNVEGGGQGSAWAFEVIPPLRKQLMDYPNEVSHPRMFRWLAAKSNTNIKDADLFNPTDDAVMHPWIMPIEEESVMTSYITLSHVNTIANLMVELIKKELAGAIAIRRAVRQGQPNVEALHDQLFTKADPGASSGGVVSVGGANQKGGHIHRTWRQRERDSRQAKNAKPGALDYPRPLFRPQDFQTMTDMCMPYEDKASALGVGLDFLVPTLVLDEEETLRYVRGDKPNPYGKNWTEAKKILAVLSVNGMHYWAVEILLEEGKINVYDSNVPLVDDFNLFLFVEPLMVLLPILLRESKLMNHLPKESVDEEIMGF